MGEAASCKFVGLRHSEANSSPLEAASVRGVAETTIYLLGGMRSHREIAIRKVHEHAEVFRLNALGDRLNSIHLEGDLRLDFVQRAIVRVQTEYTVLLRYDKHRRLEVLERATGHLLIGHRASASIFVSPGLRLRGEHQDLFLLGPRSSRKGKAFPGIGLIKDRLDPIVGRGRLEGLATDVLVIQKVILVAGHLQ
jgi:hypothetical protein